ncbi:MAG: TonB-dependent receptor [Chlorobi bacterium]|nr:TonB-dependent receptor [Chlorobiota bacterium]
MSIKYILYLILILIPLGAATQTGTLKGKITDAELGEVLIGATILIDGTFIGTSTDLDGNYTITDIKPGIYSLKSQYISFQSRIFENVEIKAGEVTTVNVILSPTTVGLEEFVVNAKANHRTETALLSIQKKSSNVIEGLSAQQMQRSGDSDAASALKRLAGINVQGGRYVFIRGLSDRYSKTTINGSEIPGLDPDRNTVQLDIFPTNLLENIIVYKTFSPNLPGDFTGGYIDIRTRDFPEAYQLDAYVAAAYNSNASLNNNFISYPGSASDILGFDNGTRDIPAPASDNIPNYPNDLQTLSDISMAFNKVMAPVKSPSFLNNKMSFSVGDSKDFGNSQLGYFFGFSYKHENEFYEDGIKARYKLGGANDTQLITEHKYNDTKASSEALWGALLSISYKINASHKLSINMFKNQSGMSVARYMIGEKPSDDADGLFIETRVLQWLERSLNTAQIKGSHYFENLSKLKFDWMGSFTFSYQNEPDMRFFTNSYYPGAEGDNKYQIEPSIYRLPARYYRNMKENNLHLKGDFTMDLGSGAQSPKLKFGASYYHKKRSFNDRRIDYAIQYPISGNSYDGNVANFLADGNIGVNFPTYDPERGFNFGLHVRGNPGDDLKNSYKAEQGVLALYAMTDTKIGPSLRIVGGLRYESTLINSRSNNNELKPGYLKNNDFLPALNLTYYLSSRTNLRFNASRTLARPTFRELAPYANENFAGGETYVGNAELKRTLINNIDLKWEYFAKPGEVLSVGGFYKGFIDPIELVDNPKSQNPELRWDNVDKANVYGLEFDVRKNLDFLSALRNFKLGINISYIFSEVAIDSIELSAILATDPGARATRPMSGQSPYIFNAIIGYINTDIGFDANIVYNVNGPKIIINVKGGTPDIYEQAFHSLNFTANKDIGANWQISAKVKNILNGVYKQSYFYKGNEYVYRSFTKGTIFELGIKLMIR